MSPWQAAVDAHTQTKLTPEAMRFAALGGVGHDVVSDEHLSEAMRLASENGGELDNHPRARATKARRCRLHTSG